MAERRITRRRFDRGDFVRVGVDRAIRRDLYFNLMQGSWPRFFAFLVASFLVVNGVFAFGYLVDPGGIANMRPGSFLDALAFSVQTVATIGYGYMAPVDTWCNVLVIAESVVGMMMTAIYTGLFFAKVSRPRSSVLFSEPMIVAQHDGRRMLMFRLANERGNDVVEASMRVTLLVDEVSDEGVEMRRLYDLPLVRDNSPLFRMTWTVMHVMDPLSPLHGMTAENAKHRLAAVICVMTAFDTTYGQTTHAQHIYRPGDLRFDERFADVIGEDADGRTIIDYRRFHDTSPIAAG